MKENGVRRGGKIGRWREQGERDREAWECWKSCVKGKGKGEERS